MDTVEQDIIIIVVGFLQKFGSVFSENGTARNDPNFKQMHLILIIQIFEKTNYAYV